MPVILVASSKGGAGKSTLCTSLYTEHLSRGKSAILVDCDKQKTVSKWHAIREDAGGLAVGMCFEKTGDGVHKSLFALKEKASEVIFIDSPGSVSPEFRGALLAADVVVYPLRPSAFDFWATDDDFKIIQTIRTVNESLRLHLVSNGVSTMPNIQNKELKAMLERLGEITDMPAHTKSDTVISQRNLFSRLVEKGQGAGDDVAITESDRKGKTEIATLYNELMALL